ncbi:MAG: glycoside hydrolase family 3 N-terminal domain-containing protein [Patulibacter sp.]|nr:glycoside hydrolase family 3 N-terminal domain-containing protein [Patulibacter sp.]
MTADREELLRDAHAVLLPAIADLVLDDALRSFLRAGGRSLLLGETREEYVGRRMAEARRAAESADDVRAVIREVAAAADRPVLIAADVELGGIERFPHLVGALPDRAAARSLDDAPLAEHCARVAAGLRDLGVTVSLAPILDVLDAPNGWLDGRHWGPDTAAVSRLGRIYVEAFEAAGVATTIKHVPGHRGLGTDPAVERDAVVPVDLATLDADLEPFRIAIAAGASCAMTGPGTIAALDADRPALLSPVVIDRLRSGLGFAGLVISDDLDAATVLDGRTIQEATVEALAAGNDLLLVAASNDLPSLAGALVDAIDAGHLPASRLTEAAARVGALADR